MKPESIDELIVRWSAIYNRLQGDVTINHQEHRREAMEHVHTFVLELKHVRTILEEKARTIPDD